MTGRPEPCNWCPCPAWGLECRDTATEPPTPAPPTAEDGGWHSVWLHGDWRWLTRNMTTEQREHAAEAVARYSAYLAQIDGEPGRGEPEGLRWWRD